MLSNKWTFSLTSLVFARFRACLLRTVCLGDEKKLHPAKFEGTLQQVDGCRSSGIQR